MSDNKDLKEDMLAPMDSPSFTMQNPESPGQSHQTPDGVPTNIDIFSLSGPIKGSKSKSKGKSDSKRKENKVTSTSRVLTFADFIKNRSLD